MSLARHNLSSEAEEAINQQINVELSASYAYLAMSSYLQRDNIALHGLSAYYKKASEEETSHANAFINYLNRRGGRVQMQPIAAPTCEFKSVMEILETALQMEKDVYSSLLGITRVADQFEDPELDDFVTSDFLHESVEDIKKAADLITQLQLAGSTGLGLYLFDKNFQPKN